MNLRGSILSISTEEAQAWIARNEGQHIEYKMYSVYQPVLAEVLSAYANSEGGALLIGVRDDQEIIGVQDVKSVTYRVYAAAHSTTPRLDEVIEVEEVVVGDAIIIAVIVP